MSDTMIKASIEPSTSVTAGSFGTWTLRFQATGDGLPAGTTIRVGTDTDTDWGVPQFDDPGAAEYATVTAPEGIDVAARTVGVKGFQVEVGSTGLPDGGEIAVVIGDTSDGGPGSRSQTFREHRRVFAVTVQQGGSDEVEVVTDSPVLEIVGGEPVKLVVVVPSELPPGEPFRILVKAEDAWGNASNGYRGTVTLAGDGITLDNNTIDFSESDAGAGWLEGASTETAGVWRLTATDDQTGLAGTSNPLCVVEHVGQQRLHWADPHGGQLVDREKFAGFFAHARDVAGIQFAGFQRNADVLDEQDLVVQQDVELEFHEPGRFIAIPGYEWSGKTWDGGHHNVYFRRHHQPIHRNAPAETPESVDETTELHHVRDLYAHYRGTDTIITPHVGGEHSDLKHHDPTLEPGVEIVSSHGAFEWMRRDALARGYHLGFLGGSDSYTGRPGDDRPGHQQRRYSKAGLTGIYCDGVTLEDFFEAMRARRVYATTGARIVARADVEGHGIGSRFSTRQQPVIEVDVVGTTALESVELFRNEQLIGRWNDAPAGDPGRVRVLWQGSSRQTSYSGIVWDGTITVHGGRITATDTLRFDSPRSHLVETTESMIRFHAWGCGYRMGVELDIQGDESTRIEVSASTQAITGPAYGGFGSSQPRRISLAPAERVTLAGRLGELANGTRTIDLGVRDRQLDLGLAPTHGEQEAHCTFRDEDPQPGINPYWVRVVQVDQEMAWTSPIWVDWMASPSAE